MACQPHPLLWVKPTGDGHSPNAGLTQLPPHPRPLVLGMPHLGFTHISNQFRFGFGNLTGGLSQEVGDILRMQGQTQLPPHPRPLILGITPPPALGSILHISNQFRLGFGNLTSDMCTFRIHELMEHLYHPASHPASRCSCKIFQSSPIQLYCMLTLYMKTTHTLAKILTVNNRSKLFLTYLPCSPIL